MRKGLAILGSTGSIGVSTLDVVSRHPDRYRVRALTANTNVDALLKQCLNYSPDYVVMVDEDAAARLEEGLKEKVPDIVVLSGTEGLMKVASLDDVDYVMAAIVGAAGLLPTLCAAQSGKRILLANKEALVMSGKLFMNTVRDNNAELLPVDSEHNAIFQCMPENFTGDFEASGISKILLTASGGPFRTTPLRQLASMTPEQACAHPNWVMGRKISVDSATMMNKGLEVIEACWLFHTGPDRIQVVLHPESIIHSMVEYKDGSILAQMGHPDMCIPISYGLSWPERIDSGVQRLDFSDIATLSFERPDIQRFPCLSLAFEAIREGGTCGAILNAANEIAVGAFLQNKIRFTDIANIIEAALKNVTSHDADSLEIILADDQATRDVAVKAVRDMAA